MKPLSLRIELSSGLRIGPGKVRLLELIDDTGSISAAGRAMDMSYRRAWLLVNELDEALAVAVVETRKGGKTGGGARLTDAGREVIRRYRSLEKQAIHAGAADLKALEALTRRTA